MFFDIAKSRSKTKLVFFVMQLIKKTSCGVDYEVLGVCTKYIGPFSDLTAVNLSPLTYFDNYIKSKFIKEHPTLFQ